MFTGAEPYIIVFAQDDRYHNLLDIFKAILGNLFFVGAGEINCFQEGPWLSRLITCNVGSLVSSNSKA